MASIYHVYRDFRGGSLPCQCGGMDCHVTAYVEPANRAYLYGKACKPGYGHTAPVEVAVEEATATENWEDHPRYIDPYWREYLDPENWT